MPAEYPWGSLVLILTLLKIATLSKDHQLLPSLPKLAIMCGVRQAARDAAGWSGSFHYSDLPC